MAVSTKRKLDLVVIDASAVLARLLPDEETPTEVKKVFQLYQADKLNLTAPNLLPYEVANALRSLVQSNRISAVLASSLLKNFLRLKKGRKIQNSMKFMGVKTNG